jgi:hypothetical protein
MDIAVGESSGDNLARTEAAWVTGYDVLHNRGANGLDVA